MGKIKITEGQLERIKIQLNEDEASNRYNREVSISFGFSGTKLRGHEIENIISDNIRLTYLIDIEYKFWGIKGITIYDIKGPSEIQVSIEYVDGEETKSFDTLLKINWENASTDEESGKHVIGVGDDIQIDVDNDSEGNIIASLISVPVYGL